MGQRDQRMYSALTPFIARCMKKNTNDRLALIAGTFAHEVMVFSMIFSQHQWLVPKNIYLHLAFRFAGDLPGELRNLQVLSWLSISGNEQMGGKNSLVWSIAPHPVAILTPH